jgi:hypothetical protein
MFSSIGKYLVKKVPINLIIKVRIAEERNVPRMVIKNIFQTKVQSTMRAPLFYDFFLRADTKIRIIKIACSLLAIIRAADQY